MKNVLCAIMLALVIGGATLFCMGEDVKVERKRGHRVGDVRRMMTPRSPLLNKRVQKELDVTADQKEKLEAIQKAVDEKVKALRAQAKEDSLAVLTDVQKAKLAELKEAREKRMKEWREKRGKRGEGKGRVGRGKRGGNIENRLKKKLEENKED